jgi:hypothetical protein
MSCGDDDSLRIGFRGGAGNGDGDLRQAAVAPGAVVDSARTMHWKLYIIRNAAAAAVGQVGVGWAHREARGATERRDLGGTGVASAAQRWALSVNCAARV